MKIPTPTTSFYPLKGGMNQMAPAIELSPGLVLDAQNYTPEISGGYRRKYGFERFDGQASPTAANYWTISATITGTATVGATITGNTSAATGKVLGVFSTVIVLGRVTGTFVSGEALKIAGVTVATSTSIASQNGASAPSDDADYDLLAANDVRADIQKVPGSGKIRGVAVYADVVYAFRDNVGGTAGAIYKHTSSGWSLIALGREIQFTTCSSVVTMTIAAPGVITWTANGIANGQTITLSTTGALPTGLTVGTTYFVVNRAANTFQLAATSGGSAITTSGTQSGVHTATLTSATAIAVGDTVTGASSGATAVVKASLLRTGTWTVAPRGTLVFATVTGAFSSGETLQVGSAAVVLSSTADTAITRAPAGRVEYVVANFTGSTSTKRMYGADGVNLGFEFDGTTYVPIRTGMTTDTPLHVMEHRGSLYLTFGASLQNSSQGNQYAWTVVTGANEFATGEQITGLLPQAGNFSGAAMAIFTKGRTFIQYGIPGATGYSLVPSIYDTGYVDYTMQPVGNTPWGVTARGVQALITTITYGDFEYESISFNVQTLLNSKRGLECASCVNKSNNDYRLFFTDGTGIVIGLTGEKPNGILPLNYGMAVRCITATTLSTGAEVTYFGSDDGYIYQDNIGTSFDGAVIEAWIRPVFNNLGSPQVRKSYKRATFEVKADGYGQVQVSCDMGYANPDVNQSLATTQSLIGAGGYWDQVIWDAFIWDAKTVSNTSISLDGTETNIGFLFYSSRAQDASFVVQGVNLQYVPRRLTRGS